MDRAGGAATVEGYNHITLTDALAEIFGKQAGYSENPSDEEIGNADVVIFNIGTFDSEGWDRPFNLPQETDDEIIRFSELNNNIVVVVNSGSGVRMAPWNTSVAAIIYAWYPGQNGALALAEIIAGKVNPSGKLPITIEKEFVNSPGYGYIPQGEELYTGWNDGEEKTRPVYDIRYREGVFTGYRWYDRQRIPTLYQFGYGLSYTSFEISRVKVSKHQFRKIDTIIVSAIVKNTGNREGAETLQLYVGDQQSSVPRPVKELKGFEKVFLKPGESGKVSFALNINDFSFWDPESGDWKAEQGEFILFLGTASSQITHRIPVVLF